MKEQSTPGDDLHRHGRFAPLAEPRRDSLRERDDGAEVRLGARPSDDGAGGCGDQYVIASRLVPTGERNFGGKVALLVADEGVLLGGVEVVPLDVVESVLLDGEGAMLDVVEVESLDEGVGPRRDNKAGPPNAAPPDPPAADAPPADPVPLDPPLEPPLPEGRPPEIAETPPPAGAD